MKLRKGLIISLVFFVTMTVGFLCTAHANCTTDFFNALKLKDIEFGQPVTFTSAKMVPAAAPLPEYCDVQGTIWPETVFEAQLPTTWNQRLFMTGGGGAAGTINTATMKQGLMRGFAAACSNGGHPGNGFDWSWAYVDPSNPNGYQMLIDFFTGRANHETAVAVKEIIKAYYGSPALHSYWAGCSGGGSQAMMEVISYPKDFDGMLVGAPALDITAQFALYANWALQALLGDGAIAATKLPIVTNAIYSKCDSIDGLVDGYIDDPERCEFDPSKELPKCPGDVDGPDCFTTDQIEALQKIYGGARTSAGQQLYWGSAFGSERFFPGIFIGPPPLINYILSVGFLQYVAFYPNAPGPSYDWQTFNFDTDPQRMETAAQWDLSNYPDLRPFKRHGGKIIFYHGLADPNIQFFGTLQYYKDVTELLGKEETNEFSRLYLIPGANHCGMPGDLGCFDVNFDLYGTMLPGLVDWVEKGKAPSFIGHRIVNGEVVKSRPLCSYPEVARYLGAGSIDEAANFACVQTVQAHVQIEPGKLSLANGKPYFTALITLPHQGDWRATSAVCEGAPAVKLTRHGHSYEATFNKQELIKITAGDEVTFTVTLFVERQGRHHGHPDDTPIVFEGSDTVKVME